MMPSTGPTHRNTPPRQISCPLPMTRLNLPASLGNGLIDYRAFKATVDKDESCVYRLQRELRSASKHEKRVAFLKDRQDQQKLERARRGSVRASLLDLVPPSAVLGDHSQTDDEESEVLFALKVSQPARLIRRRMMRSGNISCASKTTVTAANRHHDSHRFGTSCTSTASFFDESLSLLFPIEKESPMGDFSQTCLPNHDSFETSANSIQVAPHLNMQSKPPAVDQEHLKRKQRKSMMNWLANQHTTRNLMAGPDKDPSPPLFVKVIYLEQQPFQTEPFSSITQKLDTMISTQSRSLEHSCHRRVASSVA